MKRNLRPRGPRIGRSKRGHQDFKSDSLRNSALDIDTSEGLTGLFHQVSQVVCKPSLNSSKSKEICLSLINNTVNYVKETSKKSESKDTNTRIAITERNSNDLALDNYTQKFKEDWNDIKTKEKYYCLFRCILLHKRKEVRAAGLRLLRYITKTEEDVKCLIRSNSIPLIVRCIDICIDNHCERLHGIRLARHILFVAPQEFQNGLARSLIAIAKDGSRDRDKLLRSAQAIVNELAILNPQVFVECGGVSSTLYGILDCPYPRVNEALMGSLLFLLNDPNWRTSCSQFHMIMAPFSDIHYRHHEYDLEYSKNEEREMRVQSSCYAILAAIRSWPGFITLYQPQDRTLQSLIDLLRLPSESTRTVILDFLYDLFRIPMGPSHDDYDKALAERSVVKPLDPDAWKLHEGFVVAEAKVLLPHIAKFRPNLIQNYFSLILYTLIKKGLLSSLCEVVITSSQSLSIKATILIGELLHKVDQNLPDCGLMFHALPLLSEKAAGADGEQRLRASQAITALLQLSRIRLKCSHVKGMSLYLSGILESSKNETSKSRGSWEPASCSKWLGKDHDDLIQQTLKSSALLTKCPSTDWKWNLIVPVLRWPSSSLLSLEDSTYRSFIEKLVQYFKPSSKLFSRVECTHPSALIQADALVAFVEFLLEVSEEDQEKFLSTFLRDLTSSLKEVACERPFHDAYFSPSHMSITVCQYYFLAIGRLTSHSKGYSHVLKAGVYDQMLVVISESRSDVYAKLFASTLDYTINGLNRTILSKILTHKKDGNRMYATQFLRVLVRCRAKDFTKWGIELLVSQLDDPTKLVALTALDILDEAMDHEEYLEAVLKNPPSVKHLGDNGQLLLAKLVGSPQGFKTYHECNLINSLLDKWATVFNLKYVQLMEFTLSEALTHLQRGEDGHYGRRTGSKHVVHDVFVLPHLYGSLTLHKEGFSVLIQHESLAQMIEIVREADVSSMAEIYKLKSAIWCLGHIGKSSNGISFLISENLIICLLTLASNCLVYSVKGTVFHALCLIATTWEGANVLQKYGWESVRRHHHEQLQSTPVQDQTGDDPFLAPKRTFHPSESEVDDPEKSKAGFYFMDDTDDESESNSLLMDDLEVDSGLPSTARKSQCLEENRGILIKKGWSSDEPNVGDLCRTLPHDSKPPSYLGHQRSLSDCVPVIDELGTGPHFLPSPESSSSTKRATRLKNRILSSFRRKTKRRDSEGSRTSNSSTASEKVFSFLHPRRRSRLKSVESSGRDDDFDSAHSHSSTDDKIMTEDSDDVEGTPRMSKLSPIASGASLIGSDQTDSSMKIPIHYPDNKKQYPTLSPPHHSSLSSWGFPKVRPRRGVSESSHEEMPSKNSLRDFLSSSHDPNIHLGMARSPSGCSELSSVRSFGTLPARGGSANWLLNRRDGSSAIYADEEPNLHPSGQCYLGLTLPLDTDQLLLDPSFGKENEKEEYAFATLTDAVCENPNYGFRDRKKLFADKNLYENVDENSALEFHEKEKCLSCYSFFRELHASNGVLTESDSEKIAKDQSPSSPNLKNKDVNEEDDKDSALSLVGDSEERKSEEEIDAKKLWKGSRKNRFLVRKEIIRFVGNLTSFIARSSEAGLLALKASLSWAFQDACLYAEVCALLSSYSFRLSARRFIQELFLDLVFKEVFEDARRILESDEKLYRNLNEKLKCVDDVVSVTDFSHLNVPEYSINDFEGFDMVESC